MAFCTVCGAPRKEGAAFCTGCGTRFASLPRPASSTAGPAVVASSVEPPPTVSAWFGSEARPEPAVDVSPFAPDAGPEPASAPDLLGADRGDEPPASVASLVRDVPPDEPEVPPVPLFGPGEVGGDGEDEAAGEMLVPWLSEPPYEPVPAEDEPTVESRAVEAMPAPGSRPLAAHLSVGWRNALVATALTVFVPLVVSIAYGVALAFAASRDVGRIADGASAGVGLVFAAFGSRVGAIDMETSSLGYLLQSPALSWMALGALAARQGVRAALRNFPKSRALALGLLVKAALLSAAAVAALVALVPPALRGLPEGWSAEIFLVTWEPVATAAAVVALAGLWALAREGVVVPASPARPRLRWAMKAAATGARAYGLLLLLMAPLVGVAAVLIGAGVEDVPAAALATVVVGGSLATLATAVAMGATVEVVDGSLGVFVETLPSALGGGDAPPLLFLLLLTAPALVAWKAWKVLSLSKPRDRVTALATGAGLGGGFALAAWAALFLARRCLLGGVADDVQAQLAASPSLARALALSLAWGMLGGLLPALVYRIEPVRPTIRRQVESPSSGPAPLGAERYQRS